MKTLKSISFAAILLFTVNTYAQDVSPILSNFGNVFPTLTGESVGSAISNTNTSPPWYVTFDLLAPANVSLGVEGLSSNAYYSYQDYSFNPTAILLSTLSGTIVQFGTDTFTTNPFSNPIKQLVTVDNLAPGNYALQVNGVGTGNWNNYGYTDFTTQIQVLPATPAVPLPAATWLFLTGLIGILGMRRKSAQQ